MMRIRSRWTRCTFYKGFLAKCRTKYKIREDVSSHAGKAVLKLKDNLEVGGTMVAARHEAEQAAI